MAVFNFWQNKRRAFLQTNRYLMLYLLILLLGGGIVESVFRWYAPVSQTQGIPMMFIGGSFIFCCAVVALCYYQYYQSESAEKNIAKKFQAVLLESSSDCLTSQKALNIVEEMAIASSLPKPKLYLIPVQEINSLTIGMSAATSAIFITQGALEQLSREELQVMIGYEMSHIANRDFRLLIGLTSMLMSFFFLVRVGLDIIRHHNHIHSGRSSNNNKNTAAITGLALGAMLAGALLSLFGNLLQLLIGYQRVYLADACAVQFTRNSQALISLLEKVSTTTIQDLPRTAEGLTLFYLFDRKTQPSIEKRLKFLKDAA